MNGCWLEGEWRAWVDGELAPAEMEAGGAHLEQCAPCSALVRELNARAARVGSLMSALEYIPQRTAPAQRVPTANRKWAAAALLAAAALAAAAFWPARRPAQVHPAPMRQVASDAGQKAVAPVRTATLAKPRHAKRQAARVQYYVPLDDEPLDSGVVVRVTLPDSGLQADVIVDEQGRPRAVRPLN